MTMQEIDAINTRLAQFYDEGDREIWWQSEQKLLGGRRPIDCPFTEIDRLLEQLETGAYL